MSFIQNLFTSRDNNANASTFVGQQDRLWWNPDTNAFYYSDGNTAGGIPVGTSSGNGLPHGPTNSVQLNAGNGTFLGSSNLTFANNVLTVNGNVTANYLIGDGSQLTNLPGVSLGNLYVLDQTIYGNNINGNISLTPEGSGWVDVPKLAIGTSNISIVGGKLQFDTPEGVDIQLDPGIGGNILTAGTVKPTSNNLAGLGAVSSRYTDLWLGSGNINLIDQGLGVNQQIYANNGNVILGNSAGIWAGNFRITDNSILLANVSANIIIGNLSANGWVQFNRSIAVSTFTGQTAFSVGKTGLTNIYTPANISPTQAALNVVGSSSSNSQPRNFDGTMLQVTGQDNQPARISFDAFGANGTQNSYAAIAGRAARGTVDTPQALQTNDVMTRITSQGWTGNGLYASSIARLNFAAAENFTSNASVGTYANIQLTPIGSNTIKTVTSFNGNGIVIPSSGQGGTGNLGITFQDGSYQNTAYIASNAVNSVTVGLGLSQNQTTGAITIDNTGVLRATGTPQQVSVNGSYTVPQTGNIVLALPQDIATNSAPTFANLTITGNLYVTGNTISGNTIGLNSKILYLANNSTSNSDINFGGIALGNVDNSYSRTILYDLTNNRWTTAGSANASGTADFYSPVVYSANVATDYLDVTYTGHFGTAYDGEDFPRADIQAYSDINNFSQIVNWNKNAGSGASADFVAVNNLGNTTNDVNYIDLGINSSTYANAGYAVVGPNDGYLYINGGNLIVGTQTAGKVIKFHTGGTNNINLIRATLSDTGLSVVGNVTANNFISNSLSATTITGTTVSASSVTGTVVSVTGTITGPSIFGTTISATGNVVAGNVRSTGQISTTGNVTAGNLVTTTTVIDGGVSTTGNVTGANIVTSGTVSALGNINAPNVNASIAVISSLLSVTGNISGGNLITTGLISTTGNATFGNVITSGRISVTGNVDAGNLRTSGLVVGTTVSATGNVVGGNITTVGQVSATGNATLGNVSVVGNTTTANLSVTGISNLNSNANVKITGGSTGQLLSTDGAGNLLWISSGNIAPTSGTWTPTLVPETGSYTLTINNTYYQKIGGVAFCTFDITIASQSSPTGNVIMGNLPFTSASTAATTGSLAVSYYALMNSPTNVVSGAVPGSANTVTMYWQGSSDNSMNLLTGNKLKATTRLIGSVNYATV